MSKIVGINKNSDKEQSFRDLEKKIIDNIERHKELISYQIKNLEEVYDFSNSIIDKNNEVVAYTPSEKIDFIIKQLNGIKKEIEFIEKVEDFLYE